MPISGDANSIFVLIIIIDAIYSKLPKDYWGASAVIT